VAKMVSIDRFDSPDHLAGYFGIFPEENTSGVDKHGQPIPPGTMRMSKKGNDLVRKYLWMAARSASSHNPAVRPLYARLRARGTRGDVALGHCMRKLLHLVFAVWKTGQPFDPQHYPWDARTPAPATAETPVAQQETVGRNKGQEPERKAVTTASSKVEPSAAPVNSPSPARQTAALPAPSTERVDFADLRQRVTMQQVLSHLGLLDRLRGGKVQRRGPCPIHGAACDRTRCFSVNLRKNVFKCFHPPCGAQGNVLDFWAAVHRLPLREAALHMKNAFHLEQPEQR